MQESPQVAARPGSRLRPSSARLDTVPWYLLVILALGLIILFSILTNQRMEVIFRAITRGIQITLTAAVVGYALALAIGLVMGLGRVSSNKLFYNVASFYVEVVRGVPILVFLFYIAFVAVPLGVAALNNLGGSLVGLGLPDLGLADLRTRDVSNLARVIVGLGMAYGAFEAEIFRAGIESIERGQMEAARGLGMTYRQSMRHIILPQAVRRVLPALGNDFVAMVKDTSLVSVLGVNDITQLAKLYAASTFLFFQTFSILAFLYLTMTILLTRGVRWLERRLASQERR